MKVSELLKILSYIKRPDEVEVTVHIVHPNGMLGGSHPMPVKSAYKGIDWDASKFIIVPEKELQESTHEDS